MRGAFASVASLAAGLCCFAWIQVQGDVAIPIWMREHPCCDDGPKLQTTVPTSKFKTSFRPKDDVVVVVLSESNRRVELAARSELYSANSASLLERSVTSRVCVSHHGVCSCGKGFCGCAIDVPRGGVGGCWLRSCLAL